ncbi:MAG: pseudouridine synthase [Cyanobacteriota bacterium]|nr:pseudouridine synthase [Cyanobacteriota bacterium]
MPQERLQKLIAAAGLASRRHAEDWLRQGRVLLNGRVAQLGDRADPAVDQISCNGRLLLGRPASRTLLLHKPMGVLCSCHDPHGRPTVLDLLPRPCRQGQGLHPVGRLDADSRGALLLTNDGDLTLRLTHPRYGHAKTYRVWVDGHPNADALRRWRCGVPLDGRPSQPVVVRLLEHRSGATHLELVMGEGRHRQIRRTAAALGHPVRDLLRIAIGTVALADLPEGHWRDLSPQEWGSLQASSGVRPLPP